MKGYGPLIDVGRAIGLGARVSGETILVSEIAC